MGKYIKVFEDHTAYQAYINGGVVVKPNVSTCKKEIEVHYNPIPYSDRYLTFVAKANNATFTFDGSTVNSVLNKASYSIDNGATWTEIASGVSTPSIDSGEKILWKGEMTPGPFLITYYPGIGSFTSTAQFDVEGNVMSLLFGDDFKGQTSLEGKDGVFYGLFSRATNVVGAKNLSLPATTLAKSCYGSMFRDCTSLTTAPELPATTLATSAYTYMFSECTNLTTAPELPATNLAVRCYYHMFSQCTNLTTAPELPATTLANNCYQRMFWRCSNLNSVTCLATDISATDCTNEWLDDVATNGTFYKNPSMDGWTVGTNVPQGWAITDAS